MIRRLLLPGLALGCLLFTAPAGAQPPDSGTAKSGEEGNGSRDLEWAWLRLDLGYSHVDLTTFEADSREFTADLIPTSLDGGTLGFLGGARLLFLSIALRGNVAFFSDASEARSVGDLHLWTVDANLLFHLLSGYRVEPYLLFGGGYSAFGEVGDALGGVEGNYAVRGPSVRAGAGVEFFLTDDFALGVELAGSLLFLTRPGVSAFDLLEPEQVETLGEARARVLEGDDSSVGTSFSLVVAPSWHF